MAEQDNSKEKETGRGRFLSKMLGNNRPPDLEELIASGALAQQPQRTAQMLGRKAAPMPTPGVPQNPAPAAEAAGNEASESLEQQMEYLHAGLAQVFDLVSSIHDKEVAHERVFDTLYKELNDYKNDFFYERLKPVLRPLLFLYDSIEQFQQEVESNGETVNSKIVIENMAHFLDQLVDALSICETHPLEAPDSNAYDPKAHKIVDVVPVAVSENNTVQRVVRGAWTLNGAMLRQAEIVIGKAK